MSCINEIDINLSYDPGNICLVLSDEFVIFKKTENKTNKYSLLCIQQQTLIDITHIITSNDICKLDSITINYNGFYCGIIRKNIFCVVKFDINMGTARMDIIHYAIENNMKEINKMSIQFIYCISECSNHAGIYCITEKKEQVYPQLHIKNIGPYEYLLGIYSSRSHKQLIHYLINIQSLEKKMLFDGYEYYQTYLNYTCFHGRSSFIIFNHYTKEENTFNCNKIQSCSQLDKKYLFVYTYNEKVKYLLLSPDADQKDNIKFSAELKNKKIIFKANDMFNEYSKIIDEYQYYNFIHSIEMMYEIIQDAINKNDNNVKLKYNKVNDTIEIEIEINIRYINGKINFLLSQKPVDKLEILEKKIDYLYKHNEIDLL